MDAANILIVEDDPDINRLPCAILEGAGNSCRAVFSGSEAMLWADMLNYIRAQLCIRYFAGNTFGLPGSSCWPWKPF